MGHSIYDPGHNQPAWNAGRQPGAKRPLQPKQVLAIRFWLDQERRLRDRALFDLAVDAHLTPRQYARLVDRWVALTGLDPAAYGTHSLRRTKVSLLYRKTGNLRACQLLLGHTKLESTVRYLGVEVDDALELSEALEL